MAHLILQPPTHVYQAINTLIYFLILKFFENQYFLHNFFVIKKNKNIFIILKNSLVMSKLLKVKGM